MQVENKCCENLISDTISDLIETNNKFPVSLLQSIDSIIKKEGFITYDVEKKVISTDGGSFLGTLYEVNIKGKTEEGEKESNIFFKHIIPADHHRIFSLKEAYFKESFAYKDLAPIFTKLQNEANVPKDEKFNMAKSYEETNLEVIVLENLAKRGFTTPNRMDIMPLKYFELSIQQLARFHGLSYILQKKRPKYFNKNIKIMKQPFNFNEEWQIFIENLFEISSKMLNNETKEKVKGFLSTFLKKWPAYMEDSTIPGCCLCHGDYRPNNVLMKEINGEITEVMIIDYQILSYGCPLNDFMYFIFTCTDREFRNKHLLNLKDFYYNSLKSFLKYFDMDVEDVYPRMEFEKQFKERYDYGLMLTLYVNSFIFTCEDELPDIGKDDFTKLNFNLNIRGYKRIQDGIDEFLYLGYL